MLNILWKALVLHVWLSLKYKPKQRCIKNAGDDGAFFGNTVNSSQESSMADVWLASKYASGESTGITL